MADSRRIQREDDDECEDKSRAGILSKPVRTECR